MTGKRRASSGCSNRPARRSRPRSMQERERVYIASRSSPGMSNSPPIPIVSSRYFSLRAKKCQGHTPSRPCALTASVSSEGVASKVSETGRTTKGFLRGLRHRRNPDEGPATANCYSPLPTSTAPASYPTKSQCSAYRSSDNTSSCACASISACWGSWRLESRLTPCPLGVRRGETRQTTYPAASIRVAHGQREHLTSLGFPLFRRVFRIQGLSECR